MTGDLLRQGAAKLDEIVAANGRLKHALAGAEADIDRLRRARNEYRDQRNDLQARLGQIVVEREEARAEARDLRAQLAAARSALGYLQAENVRLAGTDRPGTGAAR